MAHVKIRIVLEKFNKGIIYGYIWREDRRDSSSTLELILRAVLCLVAQFCPTLCDPIPCPWGFSRQECWSGLPCPLPGDLPNPGIELESLVLQVDSLLAEPLGKPSRGVLVTRTQVRLCCWERTTWKGAMTPGQGTKPIQETLKGRIQGNKYMTSLTSFPCISC